MPELHATGLEDFVKEAAKSDVRSAIAKHGQAVNAREAAAVAQLSPAELKTLSALRQKIFTAATKGMDPGDLASWACGVLC